MAKNRKFIISWNNYPKEMTIEKLKDLLINKANVEYLILGYEVGEIEETPHIQGYVRFTNPQHFDSIRKLLKNEDNTYGYLKEAVGNDKQNQTYCSKQNNYIEYGQCIENENNNIDNYYQELIEDIINGVNFIDICKKYSNYVCKHYRDFKQLYNELSNAVDKEKEVIYYKQKTEELLNNEK